MQGKNDNYSSFIFFHNIGDLKLNPSNYDIYSTEFWYGDNESSITDEMLKDKVENLRSELESQGFGYSFTDDFSIYAHEESTNQKY